MPGATDFNARTYSQITVARSIGRLMLQLSAIGRVEQIANCPPRKANHLRADPNPGDELGFLRAHLWLERALSLFVGPSTSLDP